MIRLIRFACTCTAGGPTITNAATRRCLSATRRHRAAPPSASSIHILRARKDRWDHVIGGIARSIRCLASGGSSNACCWNAGSTGRRNKSGKYLLVASISPRPEARTCHGLPPTSASDPQKKSISVPAIGLQLKVAIEKLVQAVICIVRCLAVVFQPVIKQGRAGLEVRVIESVVRAGVDNQLDWRPVVAPAGDFIGAVCRRRPIVEGPNEDERGYPRSRHGLLAWRIERSRRPEPQVAAWRDELFERIGLRHGEGNPSALREADRSHTVWIDEGLASQEDQSPVGIRPAPEEHGK